MEGVLGVAHTKVLERCRRGTLDLVSAVVDIKVCDEITLRLAAHAVMPAVARWPALGSAFVSVMGYAYAHTGSMIMALAARRVIPCPQLLCAHHRRECQHQCCHHHLACLAHHNLCLLIGHRVSGREVFLLCDAHACHLFLIVHDGKGKHFCVQGEGDVHIMW